MGSFSNLGKVVYFLLLCLRIVSAAWEEGGNWWDMYRVGYVCMYFWRKVVRLTENHQGLHRCCHIANGASCRRALLIVSILPPGVALFKHHTRFYSLATRGHGAQKFAACSALLGALFFLAVGKNIRQVNCVGGEGGGGGGFSGSISEILQLSLLRDYADMRFLLQQAIRARLNIRNRIK